MYNSTPSLNKDTTVLNLYTRYNSILYTTSFQQFLQFISESKSERIAKISLCLLKWSKKTASVFLWLTVYREQPQWDKLMHNNTNKAHETALSYLVYFNINKWITSRSIQ